MKIRNYKKSDEKQVKDLIEKILNEIFGKSVIKKWENFTDYSIFYVAEERGKIIGTIALKRFYKHQGILKRLYVDKEYRKKGIAKKLYSKIIDYCTLNSINKVYLTTYPQMRDAQKFYIKNGFKKTGKKYKDGRVQFFKELDEIK